MKVEVGKKFFEGGVFMSDKKIWYPLNYSPNLSVGDWKKLLQNKNIFSENDLEIMKRFLDFGDNGIFQATYSQLAFTYGENYNFYQKNINELGKKVFYETNCPIHEKNFKNILLEERDAGNFARKFDIPDKKVYKLRYELADALLEIDLHNIKLYSDEKISRPIDISKKTALVALAKLEFVVLDSDRKIPIKSWLDGTDYRGYYFLLNKKNNRLQIVLEEMGFQQKSTRLTDDVATKLLAKGLAYKVSRQEFEVIKSQFERGTNKFSQITADEYKNLKYQLEN